VQHRANNNNSPIDPSKRQVCSLPSSIALPKGPTARMSSRTQTFVVKVVITPSVSKLNGTLLQKRQQKRTGTGTVHASCTITMWTNEDTRYFTLIFADIVTVLSSHSLQSEEEEATAQTKFNLSSQICSGVITQATPKVASRALPQAQCSFCNQSYYVETGSTFPACVQEKASRLKDAILNSISMPAYGSFHSDPKCKQNAF
jgi:hypothetical protein